MVIDVAVVVAVVDVIVVSNFFLLDNSIIKVLVSPMSNSVSMLPNLDKSERLMLLLLSPSELLSKGGIEELDALEDGLVVVIAIVAVVFIAIVAVVAMAIVAAVVVDVTVVTFAPSLGLKWTGDGENPP